MTTQNKKIIHCVCSLNSEGVPTPFSSIITEVYPTPPATPDEYNTSSPNKTIPLLISAPMKNDLDARSRPVWNTINANQSDYSEQILIESRPMKNAQIDKELYSYTVKVLDGLFQTAPVISPQPDINQQMAMWKNYSEISKAYAEAIAERYNEGDLVWIHGHGLLMVPYFLRKNYPDIKIGLSFYAKFPNWEHLSDVYEHASLLKSMLQADHIAFQTSLDAQQFDTACKTLINNTPNSNSDKMGVFPSVLDKNTLITSSVTNQANAIRHMFSDKQIIFCKGTNVADVYRSLAAFAELISRDQYLAQHLIFLLHVCPLDIPFHALESVPEIVRLINQLYGTTDSVPVHFYHQEIDKEEQLALMKASDLGLLLGSHPSTNILAQEFMQSHSDNNSSPLILSSNSNMLSLLPDWSFPTLKDTDDIHTIASTISNALKSDKSSTCVTYEAFRRFLSMNDVTVYKNRFVQKIMTKPEASLISKTRLLLYYDTKKTRGKPNILPYLHHLTENPSNSVWIISDKDKNTLDQWEQPPSSLGFVTGSFIKKPASKKWIQIENADHSCILPTNEYTFSCKLETNEQLLINKYPAHSFSTNDGFIRYLLDIVESDAVYVINHLEQEQQTLSEKEIYPTSLLKNTPTLLSCN